MFFFAFFFFVTRRKFYKTKLAEKQFLHKVQIGVAPGSVGGDTREGEWRGEAGVATLRLDTNLDIVLGCLLETHYAWLTCQSIIQIMFGFSGKRGGCEREQKRRGEGGRKREVKRDALICMQSKINLNLSLDIFVVIFMYVYLTSSTFLCRTLSYYLKKCIKSESNWQGK